MKKVCWCVVAAVAALAVSSGALGQTGREYASPPPASPAPAPSRTVPRHVFAPGAAASARRLEPHEREERRFLKEAAAASRFQAEAARLVAAKPVDAAVRSLAGTLADQYTLFGNDLLRLLHQRGMAAPMLENAQRKVLLRLARLQGRKLEREYLELAAVAAQQDALRTWERARGDVQDPAVQQWIDRTLPALRYRLAEAERLAIPARAPAATPARALGHAARERMLTAPNSR